MELLGAKRQEVQTAFVSPYRYLHCLNNNSNNNIILVYTIGRRQQLNNKIETSKDKKYSLVDHDLFPKID